MSEINEVSVVVRRFRTSDVIEVVNDSCKEGCKKLAGILATEQARTDGDNRRLRQDDYPWVKDEVFGRMVHCAEKPRFGCAAEVITGKVLLQDNQYGLPATFEPDTGMSRLDRERNERVREITESLSFRINQDALSPTQDRRIGK